LAPKKLIFYACFTAGHVVGHADNHPEKLATSALAFELVCHYGGPRFTVRVIPVIPWYQMV